MDGTATDRLLDLVDVRAKTKMSRGWIYGQIREGKFPRPVKTGARAVRWRASDVDAWIASLSTTTAEATR